MKSAHKSKIRLEPRNTSMTSECTNDAAYINALVQEASIDNSNQNDIGLFYGDLSNLSRPQKLIGNIMGNLGGDILSQFKYELSMNQSKLLLSNSNLGSQISSHISSFKNNTTAKKSLRENHQKFLFGK